MIKGHSMQLHYFSASRPANPLSPPLHDNAQFNTTHHHSCSNLDFPRVAHSCGGCSVQRASGMICVQDEQLHIQCERKPLIMTERESGSRERNRSRELAITPIGTNLRSKAYDYVLLGAATCGGGCLDYDLTAGIWRFHGVVQLCKETITARLLSHIP
jgi:hypothetical protein